MKRMLRALGVSSLSCLSLFILATTLASAAPNNTVCICHVPPGNPAAAGTICINAHAVPAHLRHGDTVGACPVVCGGSSGVVCGTGAFCEMPTGVCSATATGVCTIIPISCAGTVDSVCGCNGTTYDNACLAAAAGVTVSHTGDCVTTTVCGGSVGGVCALGEFCKRDSGNCTTGAGGICTPIPASCPTTVLPVCGCDGTTYSNSCFADAAAVTMSATNACVLGAVCGGLGGGTCAAGQFCGPLQGDCANILGGHCMTIPLPTSCSPGFDPVCGCDAVTYVNACLATAAGVGMIATGPCPGDLTCGAGGPACAAGNLCKRPNGVCGDVAGTCTPIPTNCPAIVEPVCGCNGTTYSNACVAETAGVTVANDGPCVPVLACGGDSLLVCPTGQFCGAAVGTCASGSVGICTQQPATCPIAISPVCGCDATTYTNACFAAAAGVTVNHVGACL